MNSSQNANGEQDRRNRRKPYITPQVQIYGDLRGITQAIGEKGMNDGGSKPDKTNVM